MTRQGGTTLTRRASLDTRTGEPGGHPATCYLTSVRAWASGSLSRRFLVPAHLKFRSVDVENSIRTSISFANFSHVIVMSCRSRRQELRREPRPFDERFGNRRRHDARLVEPAFAMPEKRP